MNTSFSEVSAATDVEWPTELATTTVNTSSPSKVSTICDFEIRIYNVSTRFHVSICKCLTFGFSTDLRSPCPRHPSLPLPRVSRMPRSVTRQTKRDESDSDPPTAICVIVMPLRPSTARGGLVPLGRSFHSVKEVERDLLGAETFCYERTSHYDQWIRERDSIGRDGASLFFPCSLKRIITHDSPLVRDSEDARPRRGAQLHDFAFLRRRKRNDAEGGIFPSVEETADDDAAAPLLLDERGHRSLRVALPATTPLFVVQLLLPI